MCDTCGCGDTDGKAIIRLPGEDKEDQQEHSHDHEHNHGDHSHSHDHKHDHSHDHDHQHSHDSSPNKISVETDILAANKLLAERNKGFFEAIDILTINLMSSPGSGKTTLLEKTITDLKGKQKFYVIEGDQQTMNDANRIHATGAPAVQVNTGNGCHLDAEMINRAMKEFTFEKGSVLMIENVGNLVCPSLFDLGEKKRVVIISVTEGDDKPVKYPTIFETADLCIINKTDLLPYVEFNIEELKRNGLMVNHHLEFIELSAKSGEGMEKWYEWLMQEKA